MKRALAISIVVVLLLFGCSSKDDYLGRGMALRERMLQGNGCSFRARVTADYGDKTYSFAMECKASKDGSMRFVVLQPDSIAGIAGVISGTGGQLTFDDKAIAFELLADGEVSPISAPWLLVQTLRGGYLSSCGMDGNDLRLTIDDSYEEDALQLDIWLDSNDRPKRAEILWQGRRVLSVAVEGFSFV